MLNLTRFPFKSMLSIINFLNKQGYNSESEIQDIQIASQACYSDTMEILEMLSYLTAFGQVQYSNQGWSIVNKQPFSNAKFFRTHYLTDVVKILSGLNDKPQNLEELALYCSDIDIQSLKAYLIFLQKISVFGFVQKTSNGWKLTNYLSKDLLNT